MHLGSVDAPAECLFCIPECLFCEQFFCAACAQKVNDGADACMTKNGRLHIPCRYMIATHAEVQRKVAHELDALGLLATPANPHPRQLDYEDISKLVYLNNCIKARLLWLIMQAALIMHLFQMGTQAAPLRTLQACKLHR